MSEYQYHEWQTVDRVLTPAEQSAVSKLSSHIEVSPGKAVVTYNWGDFKHDPHLVLLQYFDAYFYMANWGSMRLMFRFPKGLLDVKDLEPYLDDECVTFETHGEYQVLDISFNPEGGGWIEQADVDLSDFISLRADLLQGDTRLLYLIWLKVNANMGESEDDPEEEEDLEYVLEPPVSPGLMSLTPALGNVVKAFDIDLFLIQAAAEASTDLKGPLPVNYRAWISHLTRVECDAFLTRLAEGDAAVGMALRKRLSEFSPQDKPLASAGQRSIQDLLHHARELEETKKTRKAAEARQKHIAAMQDLAKREPQVWQQADILLEKGQKIAAVYDEATALLEQLQQLSEFQNTRNSFNTHVRALAEKYSSRPSLIKRWKERGWI